MYSKATHFLLEFIQNADDNEYAHNVTPTLTMKFDGRNIQIECNEVGFNEANVRAICKIGVSTKKDCSGYIGMTMIIFFQRLRCLQVSFLPGEKGIGEQPASHFIQFVLIQEQDSNLSSRLRTL